MRIKIIATGSTKWERFIHRWGISFLIGEDVLFDSFGDPGVFLHNLRKFNVNTTRIKNIILSHDDWDHIAGLWYLLDEHKDITVYICPSFKQEIKNRIASFGARVVEVGEGTLIKDDIYSTGELYGESAGRKIYEQSVVIKTAHGLAVICGCAHPGVVNIVRYVKERFQADVHVLIGGFHLKDSTDEMNKCVIQELQKSGIRRIAPMHCTGKRATKIVDQAFGQDFIKTREGDIIEL
ncbi:MAG: MBL fold metallo-hydrolase [Candidatus Omnitrophica bacterium]|nr:MBL fold metallo-hydrolase [Candidatus Omnitrophota bacterium]MDD5027400.1 MBL fold metallo-hydrolase [Candidatus Omnitrophota bacterium]MDD5662117.1 MBL fold metallo-hydrolase [Candidatus Omnitrophota bacterium]